jgi:glutathione S-transferase
MDQLILHHYPQSPYSEKIRLGLGSKGLAWQSVIIPSIMPKPDLTPLTGGYRKTPVLQIGADIYCDTELIMRVIDRRQPQPSFYAESDRGTCALMARAIEAATFFPAVALVFGFIGDGVPQAFIDDREKFSGQRLDPVRLRRDRPIFIELLRPQLDWLVQMLADGRPYLLGGIPSLVDFAAYHPIWFMRMLIGPHLSCLPEFATLLPWHDRVAAIGHGAPSDLSSSAALDIARQAEPKDHGAASHDPAEGRQVGDRVTVTPNDTGRDPVEGTLVALSAQEIVIARDGPMLGRLHVHFPRVGFVVVSLTS